MSLLSLGGVLVMALFIISAFAVIFSIGKPREPMTSGIAAFTIVLDVISVLIIYGLWKAAGF